MNPKFYLKNTEKQNVFKVPNNYFEALLLSIESRIEAENDEKIVDFGKKQANFEIPNGYFDNLSDKILMRISESKTSTLHLENLEKVNVFSVPNGYFNGLESISTLESQDKINVFSVPSNYFDALSEKIIAKTSNKIQAKVVKVNWWKSTPAKWAAAASIVFLIGFLWMFLPNLNNSETELALQKVSNEEISHYLENQDLSHLEYEATNTKIDADNQLFEHLNINEKDILEHLENEETEEI